MTTKKITRRTTSSRKRKATSRGAKSSTKRNTKKVTKKQTWTPEPISYREQILLSSTVYNTLVAHNKHTQFEKPHIFLLGEDKKQIVRKAVHLENFGGCSEMASVTGTSLAKAYVEIAKEGYIPIGMARTGSMFDHDDGSWASDSGADIYTTLGYILTVSGTTVSAQVFVPSGKYSRDPNHNNFTNGDLKRLSVGVTDK